MERITKRGQAALMCYSRDYRWLVFALDRDVPFDQIQRESADTLWRVRTNGPAQNFAIHLVVTGRLLVQHPVDARVRAVGPFSKKFFPS